MLELNFTPFPVLETERLILRRVTNDDEQEIFVMRNDPVLTQHTWITANTLEEARGHIERIDSSIQNNEVILWGIVVKGEQKLAGTICYWNVDKEADKAELGYGLLHPYMGKGIMQEALEKILDYGFGHLKLRTVEAYTHSKNEKSKALLVRNGFTFVEDMEARKDGIDKLKDRLIYELKR